MLNIHPWLYKDKKYAIHLFPTRINIVFFQKRQMGHKGGDGQACPVHCYKIGTRVISKGFTCPASSFISSVVR